MSHLSRSAPVLLAFLTACGPPPATFTEVRDELLVTSCALSSCHGGGTGDLTMSADDPGAIYGALVDVPSVHDPAILRVKPGDPDNSFLIQKLEGTHANANEDNEAMPPPLGLADRDPEMIERVRSWIENGAPND